MTIQTQQGISFNIAFQSHHSLRGQNYDIGWEFLQTGSIFILLPKPAKQAPLTLGAACPQSGMQSTLHAVLSDEKGIPGPERSLMETVSSICLGST